MTASRQPAPPLTEDEARVVFDQTTRELREDMWMPRQTYPCGCNHAYICPGHAELRAVEHYHPETIR